MPLTLVWNDATNLPVEAETLRPDTLAGLSADDIARMRVPHGNRSVEVGALWTVSGRLDDGEVRFEGNHRPVRGIGTKLGSGRIRVAGDVGPRTAIGMAGGEVAIEGSAGVYAGAEMTGGLLRITGDADDGLGSALPGSRLGMRDGVILVGGSVGSEVGLSMRRGLIAIGGGAGTGLGRALVAGSIFAFGPIGRYVGMGMKRGTIALFGLETPDDPDFLPTFAPSVPDRPPFVTIYLKALRNWSFAVPEPVFAGPLMRYNGDRAERGQGEILVWNASDRNRGIR